MTRIALPPFAALRAFDAFGRLGGVRKAAAALGVSHAIVSRHLRDLEAHLGTPLIDRPSGGLTKAGRSYHQRVAKALTELASATEALSEHQAQTLHIWCVHGLAYHWLTPRLAGFRAANPTVELDLRSTDQGPDFGQSEVDGDIRYIRDDQEITPANGVRRLGLARPRIFPVASPDCLARLPQPILTAADLLAAPLIQERDDSDWRIWLQAQGLTPGELKPVARLWHAHLTLSAAREGQGVAMANDFLLRDDVESGRLVRLAPATGGFAPVSVATYTLLAREDRWRRPALSRFRDWLRAQIGTDVEAA